MFDINKYDGVEVLLKLTEIAKEINPLRPEFSSNCDAAYAQLAAECWSFNPKDRPTFDKIVPTLMDIQKRLHAQFYGK